MESWMEFWIWIWIDSWALMDMEMAGMMETLDGFWLVWGTQSASTPLYTCLDHGSGLDNHYNGANWYWHVNKSIFISGHLRRATTGYMLDKKRLAFHPSPSQKSAAHDCRRVAKWRRTVHANGVLTRCKARFPLPESTARVNGPSWWVTSFHYPSTRAVLKGARFH